MNIETQVFYVDLKKLGSYPATPMSFVGSPDGYEGVTVGYLKLDFGDGDDLNARLPASVLSIPAIGINAERPLGVKCFGFQWSWGDTYKAKAQSVAVVIGAALLTPDSTHIANFDVPVANNAGTIIKTIRCEAVIHVFDQLEYSLERDLDGMDIWADDIGTNAVSELYNHDALMASIDDIIFTGYHERPGRLEYGSPVPGAMWMTMTKAKIEDLLDRTIEAVSKWESRVRVDKSRASINVVRAQGMVLMTLPIIIRAAGKQTLYRRKFSFRGES